MILDLLRHGEVKGGRLYRGNQDDALTDKGWQQMLDSTEGKSWDVIFTSPLSRCCLFAQHLGKIQNTPCRIINAFEEIGFGDWQGLSAQTIGQQVVDAFKDNPVQNQPPGAENLYAFETRVLHAFKHLVEQHSAQSCLIVTHAGVIRVIKSYLLQRPIEKMFLINIPVASCEHFQV